jgi:hypothetical protein
MTSKRTKRRAAVKILGRDALLALKGGRTEEVYVPELGGKLLVAAISAGARDVFDLTSLGLPEDERRHNFRARLLVMTLIGDDGKPLYTTEDIPALSSIEARVIDPLVEVAMRLNGLSESDRETLEGNS